MTNKSLFYNSLLHILLGLLINLINFLLKSNFLYEFLHENLITILIALAAINATTISVIMTKLKELHEAFGIMFNETIVAMKGSIVEQIVLIILASIFLILRESSFFTDLADSWQCFLINSLIIGIFTFSLHVLYDTTKSIFIILNFENDQEFPKK